MQWLDVSGCPRANRPSKPETAGRPAHVADRKYGRTYRCRSKFTIATPGIMGEWYRASLLVLDGARPAVAGHKWMPESDRPGKSETALRQTPVGGEVFLETHKRTHGGWGFEVQAAPSLW